jgi:hypothetical protein
VSEKLNRIKGMAHQKEFRSNLEEFDWLSSQITVQSTTKSNLSGHWDAARTSTNLAPRHGEAVSEMVSRADLHEIRPTASSSLRDRREDP